MVDSSNTCVMEGERLSDNCYLLTCSGTCYTTSLTNTDIWHRRLGHISHKSINESIVVNALLGILKLKAEPEKICSPYHIWKQTKMAHQLVQYSSTTRVLELLHINLIRPMHVESIGGKKYMFLCVDDYSRFTWVSFLREKFDTFNAFKILFLKLMREKSRQLKKAIRIRSNHGKEFENYLFTKFYNKHGIKDKNIGFYEYIGTWILRIYRRYIEYIRDISVFINYSKFKDIFNLYIKNSLKVYEMKTFHFLSYRLGILQFFAIINDNNY